MNNNSTVRLISILGFFALVDQDGIVGHAQAAQAGACEELGPQRLDRPSVGRGGQAPDFELTDMNGKRWSLASLRGQPVLLNFWATWCKPCAQEIPALANIAHRLDGRIRVLTVSVDQPREAVKKFFPSGTRLAVLLDSRKEVSGRYGAEKFPETFLIDSKGRVQWLFYQTKWDSPEAEHCLAELN